MPCWCSWDPADPQAGLRKELLQWGGSAEAAGGVPVSQLSESVLSWVPSDTLVLRQCPRILPAPVGRETLCLALSKLLTSGRS